MPTLQASLTNWGGPLDSVEFGRAVAAIGVLAGRGKSSKRSVHGRAMREELAEVLTSDHPIRISMPSAKLIANARGVAGRLAQEWQSARASPRIEIAADNIPDAQWIGRVLGEPGVGIASSYVVTDPTPQLDLGFRWPLRVGLLNDEMSRALRSDLEQLLRAGHFATRFVEFVDANTTACDLFLSPRDLVGTTAQLLTAPARVRADWSILLGESAPRSDQMEPLLACVRSTIRTGGVAIAPTGKAFCPEWFSGVLAEISHNQPMDVALFRGRDPSQPPPLLQASREVIDASRLSERLKDAAALIVRRDVAGSISLLSQANTGLEVERNRQLREIGDELHTAAVSGHFHSESGEATHTVELLRRARVAETTVRPAAPRRSLLARVFELHGSKETQRLRAFQREAPHAIDVRIGLPAPEWLVPSGAAPFPTEQLPATPAEHHLTVHFDANGITPQHQVATLTLPRDGDSTICRFRGTVGSEGTVSANITVLHEGRVLQIARLHGNAANGADHLVSENQAIKWDVETTIRANLDDLSDRRAFDAAIVCGERDGQPSMQAFFGDETARFEIDNLAKLIDYLDDELTQVAVDSKRFDGGLESLETAELLKRLALHGSQLYKGLVLDVVADDRITQAQSIQLIATSPQRRLPLELVYERKAPTPEATLCPHAKSALSSGACPGSCANDGSTFCPLGFWGLSRVIERHAYCARDAKALRGTDFAVRSEPVTTRRVLHLNGASLVAGSQRVSKVDARGLERLQAVLNETPGRPAEIKVKWEEWAAGVKSASPRMLVLIVHTEPVAPSSPMLQMEIGQASWLGAANLDETHVATDPNRPGPIVFLIGCDTGAPQSPLLDLVGQFRRSGAAIVLNASAKVHARHALKVVERAIIELYNRAKSDQASFGEVLRDARRALLAEGLPMVLCLSADGDADWRLSLS